MYQEFYSLKIKPFSISPDPHFLFLSGRHREAIAHLQHGLQGDGGFALLTGEVGTGKTTICRSLIENMSDDNDIAFILNPAISKSELLSTICDNFNIEYQQDNLEFLFNAIKKWMISNAEKSRNTIIIIDEAQHLSFEALEQLHLLTNIETKNKRTLKVILIGQTELQAKLKQNDFLQLAQSITTRYHLLSLTQKESNLYIQHRLNIAGSDHAVFDKLALKEIFNKCNGIPRLTNILCDRSMLAAYTQDSHIVTLKMVNQAAKEVHFTQKSTKKSLLSNHWRFSLIVILSIFTLWQAPQIFQRIMPKNKLIVVEERKVFTTPKITIEQPEQRWFNEYPQLDLSQTTFNHALASLYSVWGYKVDSRQINCDQKNIEYISCYTDNLNLQQLKKLNYPSIVRLEKDNETALYAVLYKITDKYQLLINNNLISVSEDWFRNYWRDETTILWQAPFPLNSVIKFGQQGEQVAWLANQLNKQQGLPNEYKTHFDLTLLEQVSAFQREQGLIDDGIIGPLTLIPLMQLAMPSLPRLLQETN